MPHSITLQEFLVLGLISDNGTKGLRNTSIAKSMRLDMPVVTKIVTKSQESGVLEVFPDSKDGRAQRVRITAKGASKLKEFDKTVNKAAAAWLDDIGEDVMSDFFIVQSKIAEKAKDVKSLSDY